MKYSFIILVIFILIFVYPVQSYSYGDKKTHPAITEKALYKSKTDTYFKSYLGMNNGFKSITGINGKTILDLMKTGSTNEDLLFRAYNHFYDPLSGLPLSGLGGLDDTFSGIPVKGMSNPFWAFSNDEPCDCLSPFNDNDCNEFTWTLARDTFYKALTAATETERNDLFSQFYEKLGRVLHLLEDMGVPAHTRNDMESHLDFVGFNKWYNPKSWLGNLYEDWVEDRQRNNESFISNILNDEDIEPYYATEPVLAINPQDYWDNEKYTKSNTDPDQSIITSAGLAEYSNANFLSRYAMFGEFMESEDKRNFPYPKTSSLEGYDENEFKLAIVLVEAEDGKFDQVIKNFNKTSEGQPVNNFVGLKYLADEIANYNNSIGVWTYKRTFILGNDNHEAYAKKLIPRTVWYTTGLINYFFRGKIEIQIPDEGAYALITSEPGSPETSGFNHIRLKARNISDGNDEMSKGSIQLVVKYRLSQGTPFAETVEQIPSTSEDFRYIVASEANGVESIPRNGFVSLDFQLPNDIPLWATDVYFYVIYKGDLGAEEDNAVCVGLKDVSEPTPIGFINDQDHICLNSTLYVSGSEEAVDVVDSDDDGIADLWDVYPHNLQNIYIGFSPLDNPHDPDEAASEFNPLISLLRPGRYVKMYSITDEYFTFGFSGFWIVNTNPDDQFEPAFYDPEIIEYAEACRNQYIYPDEETCASYEMTYPCELRNVLLLPKYRGLLASTGFSYIYSDYPDGGKDDCPYCDAEPVTLESNGVSLKSLLSYFVSGDTAQNNNSRVLSITNNGPILIQDDNGSFYVIPKKQDITPIRKESVLRN